MPKKRVTFDFETRSLCDLRKSGAYKYSLDPTTKPTCLAFKIHHKAWVYFLDFEAVNTPWCDQPDELRELWSNLISRGYEFSAHNALFERVTYDHILVKRYGWPPIPADRYRCTAAKAAACAIPRNLEGAGEVMRLTTQKDKRGYAAMMSTCKPTKRWTAWKKACDDVSRGVRVGPTKLKLIEMGEPPVFLEPKDGPQVFDVLYEYCKMDVKAEEALDDALPDLIESEQEVWHLNQILNLRGIRIDIPTVKKIVGIMEDDSRLKLEKLDRLTMGLVTKPGARQSILDFLALEGVKLPDLKSKTVDDHLEGFALPPDMRRLLEIRKALSMTSTKKYQAFLNRANEDDRARDLVLYHGASTGRDGGTGINPYNFPRGLIKVDKERPYAAVDNVVECHPDMLRILYGDSLALLFSALLRNMIIPSEGCELFVADFSKIEVAVLWWLADNEPGLEVLRSGRDPYKYQAAANTGRPYESFTDDSPERQLGKAQILGCGFRMSWKRFQQAAHDMYRLKLTSRQSVDAVKAYREANPTVVKLWSSYEDAAIRAVETGKEVVEGKCVFSVSNGFLWIKLPSGRSLAYREPSLTMRALTYTALETNSKGEDVEVEKTGALKKTVQFWGLDQSKKKLRVETTHGGVLTENITQAVARDLMMPALLRLEKSGYTVLLSVYDEGVCERKSGEGTVAEFVKIMCEVPSWATGLPIEAKGWTGPRYRK